MSIFFFNDTATTEIYTLSLHDALPILRQRAADHPRADERDLLAGHGLPHSVCPGFRASTYSVYAGESRAGSYGRSEEHTSELQSRSDLVCRLLLEKKNKTTSRSSSHTY